MDQVAKAVKYIARMDKTFGKLKKEGMELPDGAQGYILNRQTTLSEVQNQRLLV